MERVGTIPENLGARLDSDGSSLVVHAPGIEVADQFPEEVTERTELPTDPSDPVAVINFYDAWQTAESDVREEFCESLVDGASFHLDATPRELDWLLAEGALSVDVLRSVSQVVRVRFDPAEDLSAAVNVALEAAGSLERETIRGAFDPDGNEHDPRFVYDWSSTENRAKSFVVTYEPTLVPRAVETITPGEGPASGGDGHLDRLRDAVGSGGFAQFYSDTKDALFGTAATAGGVAAQVPEPVTAGLGLAAYVAFGSAAGASDEYRRVFGEELPVHRVAVAEQTLRLPPRTFERLRSFAGDTPTEIVESEVLTRATFESEGVTEAELTEAVQSELESVVAEHDDEGGLLGLDRTVRRVSRVVTQRGERALDPLEDLARQLENNEANMLGGDKAGSGGSPTLSEIPYIPRRDVDDSRPDDRREAVREALDETEIVVLSGPHGTGKTTVAYEACESLAAQGYEVRAAELSGRTATGVETGLRELDGDTVLYLQYGYGEYGLVGREGVGELFDLLSRGLCEKVVLEVRSESIDEFRDTLKTVGQSRPTYASLLDGVETVEFERFRSEDPFVRLTEWALDAAGFEASDEAEFEEAVEGVLDLSEGNPEIIKIAAQFAARDERPVADVETVDELIWLDVSGTLDLDGAAGRILRRLAGFGSLTTAELREMVSAPREQARPLRKYLGGDIREWMETDETHDPDGQTWGLSPSIYADVLFRKFAFEDSLAKKPNLFQTLIEDAKTGQDSLFPRLASQTGTVFETAVESGDDELRDEVIERAEQLVASAGEYTEDDDEYFVTVRSLLFDGVPLPAELLDAERLSGGATRDAEEFDLSSEAVLENLCAFVLSNGVEGRDEPSEVANIAQNLADSVGADPELFLGNVYAMAIKNLADEYDVSEERIEGWTARIDSLAQEAASQFDPSVLLENVYAMAIRQLADEYDVSEEGIEGWTARIDSLAQEAASQFDPMQFLANVYATAIRQLADEYDVSEEGIEEWTARIDSLAQEAASQFDPMQFLVDVYAMAIKNLADDNRPSDDGIPQWIERINRAVNETASTLGVETTSLLSEVYRVALRQMADEHTVASVRPWLTRFEAVLHRDDALATEIRHEYGRFVSIFDQGSLSQERFDDWGHFFLNLYFRVIDRSVPSPTFRRIAQAASGGASFAYVQYAYVLHEFDAGRFSPDDFADRSAGFLDAISEVSDTTTTIALELVANELQHVDADTSEVLPAVRDQLRTEHENGALAGRWRAQFAGEWPEPTIPHLPE